MTKASDNVFPRFLISEGGSTATPAAGRVTVYAKADGLLYSKDDAGVETALGGAGSVATDAIWDAAGDLAVGSGANTAARLAKGNDDDVLTMVAGAVAWTPPGAAGGDYAFSDEVVVGAGGVAAVTFASIPGTGRHLEIHIVARGEKAAAFDDLNMRFNNDTGSNYDYQLQGAFQTTNAASEGVGQAQFFLGQPTAGSAAAGIFSYAKIFIPYYANTVQQKTVHAILSEKTGAGTGGLLVRHFAGFWRDTSAITEIDIYYAGGDVAEGSTASLYLVD